MNSNPQKSQSSSSEQDERPVQMDVEAAADGRADEGSESGPQSALVNFPPIPEDLFARPATPGPIARPQMEEGTALMCVCVPRSVLTDFPPIPQDVFARPATPGPIARPTTPGPIARPATPGPYAHPQMETGSDAMEYLFMPIEVIPGPSTPRPTACPGMEEGPIQDFMDFSFFDQEGVPGPSSHQAHAPAPAPAPAYPYVGREVANNMTVSGEGPARPNNRGVGSRGRADALNGGHDRHRPRGELPPDYDYLISIQLPAHQRVCVFCKKNGELDGVWSNHSLKSLTGDVLCPFLRIYVCPICHATGSTAHTISYCPYNPNANSNRGRGRRNPSGRMNRFRGNR